METLMCPHIVILQILLLQAVLSLETKVPSVFVEKGQSFLLDVPGDVKKKIDSSTIFTWKFNSTDNVLRYSTTSKLVFPNYTDKVIFSEENLSLRLENVQEGDSGRYSAELSGERDTTVAEYQVSVQARVEPPVLTVDPVSSINNTCNVTCRGQNTTITSTCTNHTCPKVGRESSGPETSSVSLLSIFVAGDTIICNHSNQVSWAKVTTQICVSVYTGQELKGAPNLIIAGITVPTLLLIIIILTYYCRKQNKSVKGEIVNTDYATVEAPVTGGAGGGGQVNQCSGVESPTSIYSEVQHVDSTAMQGDPPTGRPMTQKPPESLYAMVEKHPKRQ